MNGGEVGQVGEVGEQGREEVRAGGRRATEFLHYLVEAPSLGSLSQSASLSLRVL